MKTTPFLLKTPTGTIALWGHEYVSPKMLDVLKTILSHDAFDGAVYHGVKSVVFRIDGYPKEGEKEVCASFSPDTGGIAINMEKTLERAIDRSMGHPETSLLTSWWLEMLLNFGHEIHHSVRWSTDGDKLHNNEKELKEEEERAEKYSKSLVEELVKEYNIEPSTLEEEHWFNDQINKLLNQKKKDEWRASQKKMLAERIIWQCESVVLSTFKDFVCLLTNGDIESEEWNKPTVKSNKPTLDEQLNGKNVIIDTTGATKSIAPVSVPDPVKPVPTTNFSNEDYEDMNDFGVDENPEEYAYQQPVQPPPVVQQPTPQPVQPTQQPVQSQDVSQIAKGVYMKMYNHIFTECGPLQNSDLGFSNPERVLSVPVPLTDEEKSIFVSMDHNDINGRWCPDVSTVNGILGKVMKNTKLPAYQMTLRVNNVIYKRLLLPQNPAKVVNGHRTQRAEEARAGNAIAYIINTGEGDSNKYGPYIINGEYKLPQTR